jgi:hypothetical protein
MLTQAGSWIPQARSSWVTSIESATTCVLDGTIETLFWFAQGNNWHPNQERKRTSSRNAPRHCDTRTELVEFPK